MVDSVITPLEDKSMQVHQPSQDIEICFTDVIMQYQSISGWLHYRHEPISTESSIAAAAINQQDDAMHQDPYPRIALELVLILVSSCALPIAPGFCGHTNLVSAIKD